MREEAMVSMADADMLLPAAVVVVVVVVVIVGDGGLEGG